MKNINKKFFYKNKIRSKYISITLNSSNNGNKSSLFINHISDFSSAIALLSRGRLYTISVSPKYDPSTKIKDLISFFLFSNFVTILPYNRKYTSDAASPF